MTLRTGTEIAGYRIDGVLGSGGMGVVYEATQLALGRPVALKVLTAGHGSDEFRIRFRREAMLQAALEHPHIVPVYEAGESDEGLFIAMRLVRGQDLKRLSEDGTLPPTRVLAVAAQAAAALDAAHAAGLVHRDVKPQNILVDEDDHAFLADFGLTKSAGDRGVTLTGQYTGSLDYAAPETVNGKPYGPGADLYAFAAVLYEALTGDVVFPYDTQAALLHAHLSEAPPHASERRPDLPVGLDDVIARGLAKRPEDRYRTATELVDAARAALASQPAPAATNGRRRFGETIVEGTMHRPPPQIAVDDERRIQWQLVALAVLMLLVLVVAGFVLGRATHRSARPHLAVAQAGPLTLTFPSGAWKPVAPPRIPGLTLQGAIALTSTDPAHPGTLLAGIAADAQGPGLLPPPLRAELTGSAPARGVSLGPMQALEYPSLPAAHIAKRASLILVPTPRGAAAVACLAPRILDEGTTPADCPAVAATLRLHGLRALPLDQTGPYADAVTAALTLLDGERLAGRRQLAGATQPAEQARAAHGLKTAFASTAVRIAHVTPSPVVRPAHASLVAALRRAAAAYGELAAAAGAQDQAAYAAAARRVDAAERRVDAAISALENLR
ncbi:MAG: serine/threonine protein kinase [Thermoleophilia bacterium]|nr:serine/threonine protein kinase [Thermoleophilia bacterium]